MVKYRKVINTNLSHKGIPKTKKQLEASRQSGLKVMLTKNPMKNPEIARKNAMSRMGKKNTKLTLRNIINNPMKNPEAVLKMKNKLIGRKNIKQSIARIGKPLEHLKKYQFTTKDMILNNPMKNPETARKNTELRTIKFPENIMKKIIQEYNSGKDAVQLAKEYHVCPMTLRGLLRKYKVNINKSERQKIYYEKSNLMKTQFKKGEHHGTPFKKGYIPWNKKCIKEVKHEENNIVIVPFNPAVIN